MFPLPLYANILILTHSSGLFFAPFDLFYSFVINVPFSSFFFQIFPFILFSLFIFFPPKAIDRYHPAWGERDFPTYILYTNDIKEKVVENVPTASTNLEMRVLVDRKNCVQEPESSDEALQSFQWKRRPQVLQKKGRKATVI